MKFRIPLLGLAACLALTSVRGPAVAQDYPTRAIRVIGGSAPGGISDVFMRLINDELQKRLGQPVIMENRPGGTFNIAARACADAQPDGYTICILPNEPFSYNPHLFKTLGYDPEKIEPITNAFFITQILAVNPSLNAKNLEQLAAVSKAKAGTLSYSSPSVALVLFMETFKQETGADIVRVPFKGGGDTVYGLVSGTTPVAFVGVGNLVSQLREGVVLGLAVESAQRSPLFPDVPTLTELGYKGDTTRAYFGLFAPPGTPKPIIRKLRDEIAKIAGEPAFKDKNLIQRGLEPVLDSPEEFAAFLRKDREIAGRIVKASGMTPQ